VHCQVLASGSGGNATLVQTGEVRVLVDAGLTMRVLRERLAEARLPFRGIDHVLVTHGHLDHARSAGALAKRHDATVHCPAAILAHPSVKRAPRQVALRIGSEAEIRGTSGEVLRYTPVPLPHDCDPTVAYRIESEGRVLVVLTDMGRPSDQVARALKGAHLLMLEFNHDRAMLAAGPYTDALKRRVSGGQGHLSNDEAAGMLASLAGPQLHTVVLAHLSATNNQPRIAFESARQTLDGLGLPQVEVLVASQDEVGPNLRV
jgi:phosphoribosyl 1,2-cyclic phosphodiesterase